MTFVHPVAWYLLLLAIPIILFYILKIRLRQEPVSTTIFWQQVFEERRSRSFWRRLRHLVSLILSLIFLSLLVGAVLNPVPTSQKKAARLVIVVDNSAGMNASVGQGTATRLDTAREELGQLLKTTDLARQTAILTAGGPPQIVVGFTDHLGTLRRGVAAIRPTDHPTSLSEAIALARQLIASEENSSVLVYTDGCSPDIAELQKLPKVHFVPIGEPVDNIGITRFQPRRSLGDAVGYEVLVESANFGTEPVEARLEVELGERIVDVVPLTLEPGKPQTTLVRDTTSQGGLLRATLKPTGESRADSFSTDDTVVAFLPDRPIQRVYVYGVEDFFLLRVLQSQPNIELHFLLELPQSVPENGVLILHQDVPETVPAGKVFIVDPRNGCDLFEVGETLESPIVARESDDSPLMKFVHLKNLLIPGARQLTPKGVEIQNELQSSESTGRQPGTSGRQVLAETPEAAPIYIQWTEANRDVLALTVDLKRSDLPLRMAFPIMVSQALIYFRGSGGELDKAYSTGESIRIPVKTTADFVILRSPDKETQRLPVEHVETTQTTTVSLGMLPKCGPWEILEEKKSIDAESVPEPDRVLARIACNLVDENESNLRLAPEEFYRQSSDAASLRTGVRPIWFWLALIALIFTTTEWFLYQRRWTD